MGCPDRARSDSGDDSGDIGDQVCLVVGVVDERRKARRHLGKHVLGLLQPGGDGLGIHRPSAERDHVAELLVRRRREDLLAEPGLACGALHEGLAPLERDHGDEEHREPPSGAYQLVAAIRPAARAVELPDAKDLEQASPTPDEQHEVSSRRRFVLTPDRRHRATRTKFALMRAIFGETGEIAPD